MSRSVWKGAFVDSCLVKSHSGIDPKLGLSKVNTQSKDSTKINKIWSRRSCILPQLVGQSVRIYNGRSFVSLQIIEDMVGHKFGEFASTRKPSNLRRNKANKGFKGK